MTRFIKTDSGYTPTQDVTTDIHDKIPGGIYVVDCTPKGQFYLSFADTFVLPEKIYGNSTSNCNRILNTFNSRSVSTGVLLSGNKGSGKTLLAKQICIEAMKNGIPTLIVNNPYRGDTFNMFLQSIRQDCIVLFDEFEKVYDTDDQQLLLTLFDGTFVQKKLFILTTNSDKGINQFLRDRPGRVYYWLDFKKLDTAFVIEYCQDNLKDQKYIEQIAGLCGILGFNFDMLKALVEEMNRYNETPQECMKILNARGTIQGFSMYDYTVAEESDPQTIIYENSWRGTPMNISGYISIKETENSDGDSDWVNVAIDPSNLIKSDFYAGRYAFRVEHDGVKYIIKMSEKQEITTLERAYAYGNW